MAIEQNSITNSGKQFASVAGSLAMGFIGDAFNVASAASTFKISQEEGDSPFISATKAGIDFAVGEAFYGAMANGGFVKGLAGSLVMTGINTAASLKAKEMENTAELIGKGTEGLKGLGSGHFDMTQAGYTMRQRSLNAIRSNGANINSAFGNEARNYWLGL